MNEPLRLGPEALFAGDYRVRRRLVDEGPRGRAVYVVDHMSQRKERVLELLPQALVRDAESRARFERDAIAPSYLGSEHVVAPVTVGVDEATGTPWLLREYAPGSDLAKSLAERGPPPPATAAALLSQLCATLGVAHQASQVHGNLSPSTFLLSPAPHDATLVRLQLLDLGVGRLVVESEAPGARFSPWRAPEVFASPAAMAPAADIWAIGLAAFALYTGVSFWKHPDDPAALTREILAGDLPLASVRASERHAGARIPAGFDAWFRRCVSRDPRMRFTSARDAWAVFESTVVSGSARPSSVVVPPFERPLPFVAAPPPSRSAWIAPVMIMGAIIGLILLVVVGGGAAGYAFYRAQRGHEPVAPAAPRWSDDDSPVAVSSNDPMWGSRTAPVTVVVFADFQCPFCKRLDPTLDQVRSTYGQDSVRIIWKNEPLPFHVNARPAAEAAQGVMAMAGSEAFWRFRRLAFDNQTFLDEGHFVTWAGEAGVKDLQAYRAGLTSHRWRAKVDEDHALAVRIGVKGTPAAFVNGVSISGAQPFATFQRTIDAELSKAATRRAAGLAADRTYVTLSKENFAAPTRVETKEPEEDTLSVFKVPVGKSPVRGNPDALVTIVEFADFQCPFCLRVEDTLDQLQRVYGDKVRIVWKHNPLAFHARAVSAANLAQEAYAEKGNAGFWAAHDKLFKMQSSGLSDEQLQSAATGLGLDGPRVRSAILQNTFRPIIEADQDLAEDFGATGTPHFFVNGRRLNGAQPFEKFRTIVDEEIVKAQAALARGVAPSRLYEELVKDGKGQTPLERSTLDLRRPEIADAPFKGAANAKVTIVELADFQCPFCKRVEVDLSAVLLQYAGRVKLVWLDKPLPMHKDAQLAAEAAQEALRQKGNTGFWLMHDKLFANQANLAREDLDRYASDLGLDGLRFATALDERTHRATVEATSAMADDAHLSGTPTFVINGYLVTGAQPARKFRRVIDLALSEAK